MKKLRIWFIPLLICLLFGCFAGCAPDDVPPPAPEYAIYGAKDIEIETIVTTYDFLAGVTGTKSGYECDVEVDCSAVRFGVAGKYEVVYICGTETKTVTCTVYECDYVITGAADIGLSYSASDYDFMKGISGARDGEPFTVTVDSSAVKFGAAGAYDVVYTCGTTVLTVKCVVAEPVYSISGAKDIYIDGEIRQYNFLEGVTGTREGKIYPVTVDSSSVMFGVDGEYEVKYICGTAEKTVKCVVTNSVYAIAGTHDFTVKSSVTALNEDFFLLGVSGTRDGEPYAVTVDFSDVDFGEAGEYDVIYSCGTKRVTVKCFIEASVYAISGEKDVYLTVSDLSYDFTAGVSGTCDGEPCAVSVDSSAVKFGVAGEYDVVYTCGTLNKVIKCTVAEDVYVINSPLEFNLRSIDRRYDFMKGVSGTKNGQPHPVTVNSSAVKFGVAGEYDVVYSCGIYTKTVKCRVAEPVWNITGTHDIKLMVTDREYNFLSGVSGTCDGEYYPVNVNSMNVNWGVEGTYDVIYSCGDFKVTVKCEISNFVFNIVADDIVICDTASEYDFLQGVTGTCDGEPYPVTVDSSEVEFGRYGEYEVVYTCGSESKRVKCTVSPLDEKGRANIIKDGVSVYGIVIPDGASRITGLAAAELYGFFKEATSISLPIVSDSETISGKKYISIGETSLLKNTDIAYDYSELGTDGYKIIVRGYNIYLAGATDYGNLYAVYELLSLLVNYDYFYMDCYSLDRRVENIPLTEFNITDVPDIAVRTASDGVLVSDTLTMYRMRLNRNQDDFIPVKGEKVHNSLEYIEDDSRLNDKWLSVKKRTLGSIVLGTTPTRTQICYTAQGDSAEYAKLLDAAFNSLKAAIMQYPDRRTITFSIEDNYDNCECDACDKIVAEYGAISATVVLFLNDLCEMLNAWFEGEGSAYESDIKIVFFAYCNYEAPPVKKAITLNDRLCCFYAPVSMDYYRDINDPANSEYYEIAKGWSNICSEMYIWYYSCNFMDYLIPYDNFNSMQANYKFAAEVNARYIFDQRQSNEFSFATGWSNLKNYLNYKLGWDCNADVTELTNKFFDGYFGGGAEDMMNYFNSMRLLTEYNKQVNGLGGYRSLYIETLLQEKYFPKNVVEQWIASCEAAERKIGYLKDENYELYEMYYRHIMGEKLNVLYIFVEIYGSGSTSSQLIDNYKKEFKTIAELLGVHKSAENHDITEVYAKWGI